MGPFGMPWGLFIIYVLSGPGWLLFAEIVFRTKWWKKQMETYFPEDKQDK